MKRQLVKFLASGLALIATLTVTTACYSFWHRPEIPEELKK